MRRQHVRPQEEGPSRCGIDAFANKADCPCEFRRTGTCLRFLTISVELVDVKQLLLVRGYFCFVDLIKRFAFRK